VLASVAPFPFGGRRPSEVCRAACCAWRGAGAGREEGAATALEAASSAVSRSFSRGPRQLRLQRQQAPGREGSKRRADEERRPGAEQFPPHAEEDRRRESRDPD